MSIDLTSLLTGGIRSQSNVDLKIRFVNYCSHWSSFNKELVNSIASEVH